MRMKGNDWVGVLEWFFLNEGPFFEIVLYLEEANKFDVGGGFFGKNVLINAKC